MLASIRTIALLSLTASTLAAQGPPAGGPPSRMDGQVSRSGPSSAKLLLANTAELDLTDAQVVKLAAIARRSEARRRSMRAVMDSARQRFGQPGAADSAARRQFRDRMSADANRGREQARADQRDAIALLTPDQQARAWEMVSNRQRGMGEGRGTPRGMGRGMRRGMSRGMGRGMRFGPGGPNDMPRPLRPVRPPAE